VGDLYNCKSGLINGPQNGNKHVIGVRIRNSDTVALSRPTTIDLYSGTRKSGPNLYMVILSDRSLSRTLLYQVLSLYPKLSRKCIDRSNNLNHSDHVRFLGGKNEYVLIAEESSMFFL